MSVPQHSAISTTTARFAEVLHYPCNRSISTQHQANHSEASNEHVFEDPQALDYQVPIGSDGPEHKQVQDCWEYECQCTAGKGSDQGDKVTKVGYCRSNSSYTK